MTTTAVPNPDVASIEALRLEGITKTYGSVVALQDVSFELRPGEVHALLGENGAGKSTLMAITAGVFAPDRGQVILENEDVTGHGPQQMRDRGLAIVYQHPAQLDDLTVAENMVLGLPKSVRPPLRRARSWASRQLEAAGLDVNPRARLGDLDLATRQMIEIVKALASQCRVLILDEPTEALSVSQSEWLFNQVRRAVDSGAAVAYISHRLPDVRRIADRMTILRDGRSFGTHDVGDLGDDEILALIVGRKVDSAFPDKSTVHDRTVVMSATELTGRGFAAVDLEVRAGEIVGLAGIEGNGQHEFLRALSGENPASSGSLTVAGSAARVRSPGEALSHGIVLIPGDRQAEGLVPRTSIADNMTLQSLSSFRRFGLLRRSAVLSAVAHQQQDLEIRMDGPDTEVESLSGGNQQKVLFARALLANPRVLLADEPTQGVDAGARLNLYRALRSAADNGCAVIVKSTDVTELRGLCDRVLVFSRGHVVRTVAGDNMTESTITHAAITATTTRRAEDTDHRAPSLRTRLGHLARGDYASGALSLVLLAILTAYVSTKNDGFLTSFTISNYLTLAAILGLASLAQTVVVLTGGIDLSVGPLMGLTTVVASYQLALDQISSLLAGTALVMLVALMVGVVNAVLVTYMQITPVIATLITFFALQGLSLLLRLTPGGTISETFSTPLATQYGPVPVSLCVLVVLAVTLELCLRFSVQGVGLRAVGSNSANAHRLGVNVRRTLIGAYVASSLLTGLAALYFVTLIQVGDPKAGISYTLSTVAVVVLGGVSVMGGRGSFISVVAAALLLQMMTTSTTFLRLGSEWQYWFVGAVVLAAAALYSAGARTREEA
ncbi:ATP-binding cassette domain-containing protein [Nocardioides sp.]|uniref:ATP-binding cassette domain-containing protein n=1 Tax=Nocardioides sp. TaxID=35761 RepID=UPI003783991E